MCIRDSPVTYLDRMDITQIRPLLYVSEAMVREAAQRLQLPVVHNPLSLIHILPASKSCFPLPPA